MTRVDVRVLFALFTLSGFTGLIYESLWSHYLKLFLGAAAFAQSFVLAAFMGGMALGAWIASRWSARLRNLLAAYAWIEALIGLAALAFHPLFESASALSLDHVLPALGSPELIELYKYALCALLIVPQTVLLGMTFPLMSGAVIRRSSDAQTSSGHHLALLYFTNSIGAALGALAAGFWLLAWLGLPGTMRLAGALNLALAMVVLMLSRAREPAALVARRVEGAASIEPGFVRLLLAAAFVTGAASFVYEIAWVRMLSLVLGASFQAFELMLSAFITGLALGGLWIRRRIDRLENPVRFGGLVQVAMGLSALGTVYVYHASFDAMEWALGVLQREDSAYGLFNLFSHALAFAVMLPATFLAGMTLPLFTYALLRRGHGERAIGQIYAANTLGAIAGVVIAVHLLMPELGVKLTLIVGAALDVVLGAWLLRRSGVRWQRAEAFAALIAGLLAASSTARAEVLDPERLSSGVFRYGKAQPVNVQVGYYLDGKTASVALRVATQRLVTITTNGKPDAAIRLDPGLPPTEDEHTMTMLGALPLLLKPQARTFANIGFGSGLTAEVLLSHKGPQRLDTIEIEPAMVAGAVSFFPRVTRPFRDARSHIQFEDAKSYFARHQTRYDVIVSEPSNPWVNGVASLFTTEFYRDIRRYLAPQGLFVQWLHHYEFNDRLLGSILAALAENFADFDIYEGSAGDLVVVAVAAGEVPRLGSLPDSQPEFLSQLKRVGIERIEHVAVRRIGSKLQIMPLFAPLGAPVNSDFRPVVQLEATRARFARHSALALVHLALAPVPVLEMLWGQPPAFLSERASLPGSRRLEVQSQALELQHALLDPASDASGISDARVRLAALAMRPQGAWCGRSVSQFLLGELQYAAELTLSHLAPETRRALWAEPVWTGCRREQLDPAVRSRFELYRSIAHRDGARMLERGRAVLEDQAQGDLAWRRFALLAAMVGAHASGEREQAQRLWDLHRAALYGNASMPPYVIYAANWRG